MRKVHRAIIACTRAIRYGFFEAEGVSFCRSLFVHGHSSVDSELTVVNLGQACGCRATEKLGRGERGIQGSVLGRNFMTTASKRPSIEIRPIASAAITRQARRESQSG